MANLKAIAEETGLKFADIEMRAKHLNINLDTLSNEDAIAQLMPKNKLTARPTNTFQDELPKVPELKERPIHPSQSKNNHQQTQTELQNSIQARDAIRQEQTHARTLNARERGEVMGSIEAIEEFYGRINGYNKTSANLYRLEASRDQQLYEKMLGESNQPLEETARAYQETQDVEHYNFLQEWSQTIDLEAVFAAN